MKEVTLADQVLDNLAFEVEEVPQDGQISSASSNSPLNVKIRIRKKNRKQLQDGGIISIPKIDHAAYDGEKVRVTNSDQTIMSFNVLMDRGQAIMKRPPKQKRIMQLFKRGGCLGVQNDEEQYEYSSTSQQPVKENELSEPMENLSSDGLDRANFTLAKNYSNIEASQANKQKNTDFLGICKPGGCLDPPFGEDKYSYLPKFIEVAGTDEIETKTKFNECECKENLPGDTKIKSKDEDKIDSSLIDEKEKSVPIYDSNNSIAQIKSSNSIITFPSILPSTEALNKLQKRSRSYSGSRESKSYSISNQLLETYYISPKIKTVDQVLDRETESKPCLDTKPVDIFSIKDQENLLGLSQPEADIKSDLKSNKSFAIDEKMALRSTKNDVITNNIVDNLTQDDQTVSLKDQDIESQRLPLMENHEPAINGIPETNPLYMDDSKILFDKQKVESDKKYVDTIPKANSQEIFKKSVESILRCKNDLEAIIALPHDLTVEKIDLKEIIGDKIIQETKESLTKSVESDEFKNKSETISLLKDYSTNNESLNAIDVTTKLPLEEINQAIVPSVVKSVSSIFTSGKSSNERMSAPPQDLLYESKDLITKDDAPMISSSIEQQLKDTSNSDILKFSKNLEDDSTKGEHIIDTEIKPVKNRSFSNEDFNITQKLGLSYPEENLSFREATDSTTNENIVKSDVPRKDSLPDKELLNIIETATNTQFQEGDRPIPLLSSSSEDELKGLSNEYDSEVEDHQENSIHSKISAEKKSFEELKSETVVSTSLVSSTESNIDGYSNSITKLSLQNDKEENNELAVESIHTNKSDNKNSDEIAQQGFQDTSFVNVNSVTNSEKISVMHIDINSGVSDIMNIENSEVIEKTELREDEDQKKLISSILQEEVYHKALEVTFSDKVMTERMETSENILIKPTFETETPIDLEFDKSRDKTWDSKENLKKEVTIQNDNVAVSNEVQKSFKDSLKRNYDEQDVIHLNMAFQSFETNQEGSVIKTLHFSPFDNANRYPNDNILQFQTIIRPNDGEIKIPIDSNKDLVLQIKTDQRQRDQYDGSIKDFPILNKPISSTHKSISLNEDNDTGYLTPQNTVAKKDNATTVTKTIPDESNPNDIDLHQTLDDVYKDKLLPLHDIIKKLKDDIEELTKQQTLIKEKLYKTKRVQSHPIPTSGKRCGCVEMLFSG